MTEPNPPTAMAGEPTWRLRLLDRIQNLAADHARVLHQHFSIADGAGQAQVLSWLTQLRMLAQAREDVEAHARGVGIAPAHVADARLLGDQGFHVHSDATDANPVREKMIDGVVNDTWRLQHMAVLHMAGSLRPEGIGAGSQSEVAAQFERNMAALWMRATAVSHAISLKPEEYAGMWATDTAAWHRVLAGTVDTYDRQELELRWRVDAWPGVAEQAHRDLRALGIDPADAFAPEPIPTPRAMYEQISLALDTPDDAALAHTIDTAVDMALPIDADLAWTTEPADPSTNRPPHEGPSQGAEL